MLQALQRLQSTTTLYAKTFPSKEFVVDIPDAVKEVINNIEPDCKAACQTKYEYLLAKTLEGTQRIESIIERSKKDDSRVRNIENDHTSIDNAHQK